jgi:TBC1 domain family member 5
MPNDRAGELIDYQALLLYDSLDLSAWPQRISNSRSAYSSLRDHFLKYIEHPDNLDSTVDPLTEDDEVRQLPLQCFARAISG